MNRERLKIIAHGAVQGVGFRPFVFRLANELGVCGWIKNSAQGVVIEVEGASALLQEFLSRLRSEAPLRAIIQTCEASYLDLIGYGNFEIRQSDEAGAKSALILPDIATCADCLREIFDPSDRRFRYPFTNCTNCGPRFSIIEALPYDRANTSMRKFPMCAECEHEYRDPSNRRFHAQPNACPNCGPQLQLWDSLGEIVSEQDDALRQAADELRAGKIVALKGIGGFQLLTDARDEEAVVRLRQRKDREEKPFAILVYSLAAARSICQLSVAEENLLTSIESPIVLLRRTSDLAPSVAPGNPNLGVMLPYSPLHHLLMRELDFPLVATSGNLSDEPICIDETEGLTRLGGIADFLLVHNRAIVRPIDDSVVRIMCDRELIMRRARGYAPLPITLREPLPTTLAVGAHLKNTVALNSGANVFVSQHIGDLATAEAQKAFFAAATDLPRLYDAKPELVVCDLHPDYLSTKFAQQQSTRRVAVQHHFAHIAACMAENEIDPPALGVAWDGTGLGTDQTIWGGEFFFVSESGFERVAHLRTFSLPGRDAAVKEPRRVALALLFEIFGDDLWRDPDLAPGFSRAELSTLRRMLEKHINSPRTSSVGRLFDGVAALLRVRERNTFQGQAAMELEFVLRANCADAYTFEMKNESPAILDWEPMIRTIIDDLRCDQSVAMIAAKFHNALADCIVTVAQRVGLEKVVLSGGCFQNRYLIERAIAQLRAKNFRPYWHQRIPPNDGGISLGQIVAAHWQSA